MEEEDQINAEDVHRRLHPELPKKKSRAGLIFKVALSVVALVFVASLFVVLKAPKPITGTPQACFKHDVCIDLIVLTTAKEQEIGLSNYSTLPEGTGMLFIFDKPEVQRMWMKDMDFAIDMFWIGAKGKILYIKKKALPCKPPLTICEIFEPKVSATYVLETNEGFAIDTNLYNGDKVTFKNLPR